MNKLKLLLALLLVGPLAAQWRGQPYNVTGTLPATNSKVTATALRSIGIARVQISGTWTGTIGFYGTVDGTNFFAVVATNGDQTTTANGNWVINAEGLNALQVNFDSRSSGTPSATIRITELEGPSPEVTCNSSAPIAVTAAATTEIVPLTSGQRIYICGFVLTMSAAGTAEFKVGTGTNCGTGTASLAGPYNLPTAGPLQVGGSRGVVLKGGSGQAVCVTAATGNVNGHVTYSKF